MTFRRSGRQTQVAIRRTKGSILDPRQGTESGKIRPTLVIQSDLLNVEQKLRLLGEL